MISAICPAAVYNSVCCSPTRWVCDKIRNVAQAIFGYLLRIVTFQLGEMKVRGAFTIMRIYQRLSCDPRDEKPFDPERLEKSRQLLIRWCGVEGFTQSADGGANIHYMTFKSDHFFNRLGQLGCNTIDITHQGHARKALVPPPPATEKFRFRIINIKMPNGQLVKGALLPESRHGNQSRPMIFLCHSPGRSACMEQVLIQQHLAADYDVTVWDPRGTALSTGKPSEGGYYLDAEAVFQRVLDQGYAHNRIYLSGFCEGAAVAAHLKKKYHHRGVHFIAGNPYTSMKDVVEGYGFIGRLGAKCGLKALQSTDPAITTRVKQDFFDNEDKLRNLPRSEGGLFIIHTDPDTTMPRGSADRLFKAYGLAGPHDEILRVHHNRKENKHVEPPYQHVWHRFVQKIT